MGGQKMKKLLCFLLILSILAVSSCNKKTDNEDNGKISVSDIKKIDKIENINYKNIKCDLLEVKFDTDAEKVYDYTWSVYPLSSNEQYYNEFRAALKELFPGHAINEKAFLFNGERYHELWNSHNEKMKPIKDDIFNKVTDMVSKGEISSEQFGEYQIKLENEYLEQHPEMKLKLPCVEDYKEDILSGKENVFMFIYSEEDIEKADGGSKIFFEAQCPAGNGLFNMNRGVWASEYNALEGKKDQSLESYFPDSYLECTGEYRPDSETKIKLLDGEISIKEAVNNFEEEVNSFAFSEYINPDTRIKVGYVYSYKFTEDVSVLKFLCTVSYKGISRDFFPLGMNFNGNSGFPLYSFAFMVKSAEADVIYNYQRVFKTEEEASYDEIINIEAALKTVSENLSDEVEFELLDVELVYFSEDMSGALSREGYENVKVKTDAEWKVSLFNKNDERYYYAYVKAADGTGFHYCSAS